MGGVLRTLWPPAGVLAALSLLGCARAPLAPNDSGAAEVTVVDAGVFSDGDTSAAGGDATGGGADAPQLGSDDGETADAETGVVEPCGVCPPNTTCGADSASPATWCAGEGCGETGYAGRCVGDDTILLFCQNSTLYAIDCRHTRPHGDQTRCGFDSANGRYDCLKPQ